MRIIKLFIFLFIISIEGRGQNTVESGLMPSLNLNKKLPKDWALNFKTESRLSLQEEKEYLQTDLSLLTSRKIGFNSTLAMGYLVRVPNGAALRNRFIQQFIIVNRYSSLKLSHRFGTDQTFGGGDPSVYRLRYRLSAEIPLSGQSTDPGEFFLKFNNEYVNSMEEATYDLEVRGLAFLGFAVSPKAKMELGLDYRVGSFFEPNMRQRGWLALNYYQSL